MKLCPANCKGPRSVSHLHVLLSSGDGRKNNQKIMELSQLLVILYNGQELLTVWERSVLLQKDGIRIPSDPLQQEESCSARYLLYTHAHNPHLPRLQASQRYVHILLFPRRCFQRPGHRAGIMCKACTGHTSKATAPAVSCLAELPDSVKDAELYSNVR